MSSHLILEKNANSFQAYKAKPGALASRHTPPLCPPRASDSGHPSEFSRTPSMSNVKDFTPAELPSPGRLCPDLSMAGSFLPLRSEHKCHLLREALPLFIPRHHSAPAHLVYPRVFILWWYSLRPDNPYLPLVVLTPLEHHHADLVHF